MNPQILMFLALVGGTVFLLTIALTIPVYGTSAKTMKATRARVQSIVSNMSEETRSILRERRLKGQSSFEKLVERIPQVEHLARVLDQLEIRTPAYRFLLLSAVLGTAVGILTFAVSHGLILAVALAVAFAAAPTMVIFRRRDKRLAEFETQLPDALNMISRAVRAGLPFMDALKIAGQESPDPIGAELRTTFADMNYGMGMRDGFLNLMTRVPSISLTTVVTAVLVQRESGGNLADILDKVAGVVRSRFKLQRKILTVSAEARMSAWVLALLPMGLAAVLMLTSPSYLSGMIAHPSGMKIIGFAVCALLVGIFWMRQIIRIRV